MIKKITIFAFSLLCFASFSAAQDSTYIGDVLDTQGPVYMCLKVDGAEGESNIAIHEGEIDVLSWEWEIGQTGSFHIGGGGGSGKGIVEDLVITKYVDKASPKLLLNCLKGSHFTEAILSIGNSVNPDYLVITMSPVLVTSVLSGGKQDYGPATERVSLNFAKVKFS